MNRAEMDELSSYLVDLPETGTREIGPLLLRGIDIDRGFSLVLVLAVSGDTEVLHQFVESKVAHVDVPFLPIAAHGDLDLVPAIKVHVV